MGAKSLIILFAMGIVALFALGFMADLLTKSPTAASLLHVRSALAEEYEVDEVRVQQGKSGYRVSIWVDREALGGGTRAALPEKFSELPFQVRATTGARIRMKTIDVDFYAEGSDGEAPLLSCSVTLKEQGEQVTAEVEKHLGQKVRVNKRGDDGLGVVLKQPVSEELLAQAARAICRYQYGGWSRIDINVAGKIHSFDGTGAPLAAVIAPTRADGGE